MSSGGITEPDASLSSLPGVRRYWTGTTGGMADATSDDPTGEVVVAHAAALIREFAVTGSQLGLGAPSCVSSRGPTTTWLVASRGERVIAVDVDPARPIAAIEAALVDVVWTVVAPPAGATDATSPHEIATVDIELARLRHALGAGDASGAEQIVHRLRELPPRADEPHDHETAPKAIEALVSGIARVNAGRNPAALKSLAVAGFPEHGPSLRWAAQLWGARAALQLIDGTTIAARYADAATRTALELDTEARAISALIRAEITFAMSEHERAIELTRAARKVIGSTSDQLFAESWLIEGRCLVALGDLGHAMHVAVLVHQLRPTRTTAGFLLLGTLATASLEDAEQIFAPVSDHAFLADVARERRLLRKVRDGVLPTKRLVDLLQLGYLSPSSSTLQRLRDLAAAFPAIDDIQDMLGWKLLRGGAYALARPLFDDLALRPLPEDLRTSMLEAQQVLSVSTRDGDPVPHRNVQPRETPTKPPEASRPPAQASVFSGTLQTFHLPDLLEFLRNGRKTGTLVCTSVHGIGAIRLRGGKVTDATAPATMQLVDVLIAHQVITQDQANFADGSNDSEPQRRFASKLVRDGDATAAQIHAALRARIYDAIAELLTWTEGEFSFDPTPPRASIEHEAIAVQVDSQTVLLEIFARLDESTAEDQTPPWIRTP
jgi:hypothetical protein